MTINIGFQKNLSFYSFQVFFTKIVTLCVYDIFRLPKDQIMKILDFNFQVF